MYGCLVLVQPSAQAQLGTFNLVTRLVRRSFCLCVVLVRSLRLVAYCSIAHWVAIGTVARSDVDYALCYQLTVSSDVHTFTVRAKLNSVTSYIFQFIRSL